MSNLARLAIALKDVEGDAQAQYARKRNWQSDRFLKGPVNWSWLSAAARLPGHALHVAVAVAYLDGFAGTGTVKLRPGVCAELGIKRHAAYRALDCLEVAGLIQIERKRGSAPVVTIQFPKATEII